MKAEKEEERERTGPEHSTRCEGVMKSKQKVQERL